MYVRITATGAGQPARVAAAAVVVVVVMEAAAPDETERKRQEAKRKGADKDDIIINRQPRIYVCMYVGMEWQSAQREKDCSSQKQRQHDELAHWHAWAARYSLSVLALRRHR